MRELKPSKMAHHSTPKVQVPSSIAHADHVYVRTDAVRQPLVRPYTGPFRVIDKSAKYFTIEKNGKTDRVSLDRLKPAFIFEDNNIAERVSERTVSKERESTKPRVFGPKEETTNVSTTTPGVAKKSYRDALCSDETSQNGNKRGFEKRTYVKKKPELRQDAATLRSGRVSRPPVRL